ncbi:transmembrane channel-like protein 7 isoform X2 [Mya arenaria]|uniref:transmembrane channel-like protein 7 isoform X2 n=1 Tax=Mya arenaria TaxID=6604 RepID=UPI0022DF24CA|nr:transmembrane channel-like protein 7 isoform X2 [Mya arenaria]
MDNYGSNNAHLNQGYSPDIENTSRMESSMTGNNSASPERGDDQQFRGSNSSSRAHFEKNPLSHSHGHNIHMPKHVYDRYPNRMGDQPYLEDKPDSARGWQQQGDDVPIDIEQMHTLYIPKHDGGKTLMRRRRTSSKRRSSSRKKKNEHMDMNDLLDDEDNHLLPSLRMQRRQRIKSLKDRRHDLEDEKRAEDEEEETLKQRFQNMKNRDDIGTSHLADLLRSSTLRKMKKMTDWKEPRRMERLKRRKRELLSRFSVWLTSFKIIEGKFGTAVMIYFRFIRWLFFLNLFLTLVWICVIIIPFLAQGSISFSQTVNIPTINSTNYHGLATNCTNEYHVYSSTIQKKDSTFEKVLDVLQGTGWMERTVLFYGYYYNSTLKEGHEDYYNYNMGLAYLLSFGVSFLVCLLLIVRSSAQSVKTTFGLETSVAAYTNRVIAGWDFAISNKKAAKVKKANLYFEFKSSLEEETNKRRREDRTANKVATITFIRIMVHSTVLGLLAGSLFLVYYTTDKLLQLQERDLSEIVALIVQYLPYLTITVLNFSIPIVFQKLVVLEDYSPNLALKLTLFRSIILRLASLVVLIISLYRLLISNSDPEAGFCGNRLWEKTATDVKGSIKCWETYVGQQIYKLVLLDLIVETSIVVFIQLPRRLIFDRFGDTWLIKKIGPNEFDLPQSVIDIIYSQTLCWLGMFFSPLIPLMTFIKCFIFFYLRKWALMYLNAKWSLLSHCAQTENTYRTSRSHSLFMFVLLLSFVFAFAPIGYMISSMTPSQSCGPFRVYSSTNYTMFTALSNEVETWPGTLTKFIFFLGSSGFFIPAIILLGLLMYYFWLLSQGYKHREKILSEQLKLVSKDKQFLLNRVNEVLVSST